MKIIYFFSLVIITFSGWTNCKGAQENQMVREKGQEQSQESQMEGGLGKATFAGGCFWCMEGPFEKLDGVKEVISGYTGGHKENPTYEEVSAGGSGHVEAVQIIYDPSQITYSEILDVFWRQIDPTDPYGQFVDRGQQYTTGVFYHNDAQKKVAEKSKEELANSGMHNKSLVTPIMKTARFYRAEEYHQDFYKKNPVRYKLYRMNSGRDAYVKKIWGDKMETKYSEKNSRKYNKPAEEELKNKLTPLQYNVTQKNGTERAFNNEYWDNKKEGIYVDVVSEEPLFISLDKFKSGTGWPSFTKPLEPENIVGRKDASLFMTRTEVRSKHADSHLGHVFSDGPEPTGLRYCINSAALRFVPKEDLGKEGYEEYRRLFEK